MNPKLSSPVALTLIAGIAATAGSLVWISSISFDVALPSFVPVTLVGGIVAATAVLIRVFVLQEMRSAGQASSVSVPEEVIFSFSPLKEPCELFSDVVRKSDEARSYSRALGGPWELYFSYPPRYGAQRGFHVYLHDTRSGCASFVDEVKSGGGEAIYQYETRVHAPFVVELRHMIKGVSRIVSMLFLDLEAGRVRLALELLKGENPSLDVLSMALGDRSFQEGISLIPLVEYSPPYICDVRSLEGEERGMVRVIDFTLRPYAQFQDESVSRRLRIFPRPVEIPVTGPKCLEHPAISDMEVSQDLETLRFTYGKLGGFTLSLHYFYETGKPLLYRGH